MGWLGLKITDVIYYRPLRTILIKINHIMMANRTVYVTGRWKTLFHSKAVICEIIWIFTFTCITTGRKDCRDIEILYLFLYLR